MGVAEHIHVLLDYLNHRQIQYQWGIYAGVALAIDIEMQTVIVQIILNHEASDKVPFNTIEKLGNIDNMPFMVNENGDFFSK